MSLTAAISLSIRSTLVNAVDLSEGKDLLSKVVASNFADGTGANQGNQHWHDVRTLAGTSEELDLAGSLVNALGQTVTFAKVKAIFIRNLSTTTGQVLTVGGAAANHFLNWVADSSDKVKIGPGGMLLLTSPVDGFAVTAGTGDKLKIDSGAATFNYEIILIGNS